MKPYEKMHFRLYRITGRPTDKMNYVQYAQWSGEYLPRISIAYLEWQLRNLLFSPISFLTDGWTFQIIE